MASKAKNVCIEHREMQLLRSERHNETGKFGIHVFYRDDQHNIMMQRKTVLEMFHDWPHTGAKVVGISHPGTGLQSTMMKIGCYASMGTVAECNGIGSHNAQPGRPSRYLRRHMKAPTSFISLHSRTAILLNIETVQHIVALCRGYSYLGAHGWKVLRNPAM